MSRDVIKQELLAKLKQEHCFWSYNDNSIKDIPDDMLIEKTLLHLDLEEINFISDVIFEYKYTGRKKGTLDYKTISHYTWRYVYRKPYTYGIQINSENANVEIFDFPFIYEPNWGTLELKLDDFRVQ